MLKLSAKNLTGDFKDIPGRIFRIAENADLPVLARRNHALLLKGHYRFEGEFPLHLSFETQNNLSRNIVLPRDLSYLQEGDVVSLNPADHSIRVLYRRRSDHNSLLLTERCNHHCIMCSQPPRDIDDSYIVDELLEAIPLMSTDTKSIGITGGEPTLLGDRFLQLLRAFKNNLPDTSVHVLSNGRNFKNPLFCRAIADLKAPGLMFGIPIYSADPERHNFVVQASNAWDETIEGIINLKRYRIAVEIRVVLHSQTANGLTDLADFIQRNLTMVDHVAFMGLEKMGFGSTNWNYLFVNPRDYAPQLSQAVFTLHNAGIPVSIYNTPLCMTPSSVHQFARQSISDWKNEYPPECSPCLLKSRCSGFFSSTVSSFKGIVQPILDQGLIQN